MDSRAVVSRIGEALLGTGAAGVGAFFTEGWWSITLLALGAVLMLASTGWIALRPAWRLHWAGNWGQLFSFQRLLPLEEAARTAYRKTKDSLCAEMAAREENPITWYAVHLANEDDVAVYGARPSLPDDLEQLDSAEFNRGTLINNGRDFVYYGEREPKYTNLHVPVSAMKAAIKRIRHS